MFCALHCWNNAKNAIIANNCSIFALYAIYYLIKYFKKQIDINKLKTVIADYAIIAVITIAVYISHNAIYENNPVYKNIWNITI